MSKYWARELTRQLRQPAPPLVYRCDDLARLSPALRRAWTPLEPDTAVDEFITRCHEEFGLWSYVSSMMLRSVLSVTDTNAVVGSGIMHVLSTPQARQLLRIREGTRRTALLDIGAGDGNVTVAFEPLFEHICVTETSSYMAGRLASRGFECVETSDLDQCEKLPKERKFDVVSCLNVLDRCDKPLTLLRQIRERLKDGDDSRAILAVVLPFCPFVESGTAQLVPTEYISIEHGSFASAVDELVSKYINRCGFEVEALSRVPYLSHSFSNPHSYCVLNDAILVLKAAHQHSASDSTSAPAPASA